MNSPSTMPRLKGFRFPREIISYAVWTYHRFALSTADVEDLLAEPSVVVSRETVRLWVRTGSAAISPIASSATGLAQPTNGTWTRSWCRSTALNTGSGAQWTQTATFWTSWSSHSATPRRHGRFLKRLVGRFGNPRALITDKLRSYVNPVRDLAPGADHRAHKGLNNRIEGSHRQPEGAEKIMGRFKPPRQTQRFLVAHDQIATIFRPRRYRLSAISYRHARADAFGLWRGGMLPR